MAGPAMQVLYVEDDKYLAHTVELALRKRGYFCHITDLGEQAVNLARRNRYDIIVFDIMLPDIDGYEAIERLREAGVETPYLIQSGLLDRDSLPDGGSFGVDEYLIKPFTIDEMVERMKRVVEQARRIAAAAPQYQPRERADSVSDNADNRREHRRFATLKVAELLFDGAGAPGVIINMSQNGAALRLTRPPAELPGRFGLRFQSGALHNCRVCWRYGDKVGVRFVTS